MARSVHNRFTNAEVIEEAFGFMASHRGDGSKAFVAIVGDKVALTVEDRGDLEWLYETVGAALGKGEP